MNLSHLSKKIIYDVGGTIGSLFYKRFTPLQIMILTVTREREWIELKKKSNKPIFASRVRHDIEKLTREADGVPYTAQAFNNALQGLRKLKLIYSAPSKKGSSLRSICLTADGEDLFKYPRSVSIYLTPSGGEVETDKGK